MKISDVVPNARKVDLVARVVLVTDVREVASRLDGQSHRVAEALIADATGSILLTLWDEAILGVRSGVTYRITNAYASTFKNSLRLNLGRFGKIEESPEPLDSVNENNNLSEKELPQNHRP